MLLAGKAGQDRARPATLVPAAGAVLWWGYFLIALGSGGWWTIFAPLLMTFLLVRVSGVALLEKTVVGRRPGYADYIRDVPAFIPRPPGRARGADRSAPLG